MAGWIYSLCILAIVLLHFTQSQRHRSQPCRTTRNEEGTCIDIMQCSYMYNLIQTQSNKADIVGYLRGSQCGREGKVLKICCPISPVSSSFSSNPSYGADSRISTDQVCGKQSYSGKKIVNGHDAILGDWPWIAALGYRSRTKPGPEWYCGSTLINNRYVITAAHCIIGTAPFTLYLVRLGDLHLDDKVNDGASPVDIEVERAITHEHYTATPVSNDVALVRLKRTVQFTPLITPICLPTANEFRTKSFVNEDAFVAGWGRVSFSGQFSPALQDLRLPIVDNNICKRQYAKISGSNIDNKMLCAGFLAGGKDTCQGDSGGPLMYLKGEAFYLIGVVSYGYRCAEVGFPGIYTKISEYVDWIGSKVTN